MAIIQISKIQQRTGNLVDLPQLDEAEFGWASDAKRLFIGKSVPNENIEVLTSYSNISFSQVTGSNGGNLNITNAQTGQFLTYVHSTNTWQNSGGNSLQPSNSALYTTNDIHLGNVGNVKMGGGAIGYVLETDGTGNLTWSSKGTITANIIALSNATPIVMRVATSIPYTNGTSITISGVNGTANSNVNSKIFYVKVASDFPTSGNVTLYTDSVLSTAAVGTSLTYTNSPNALAITSVGGGGATAANGSTYSVQFNNSGIISGDSNITWDFNNRIFAVSGNANITGNINGSANIVGSRLVSNVVTGSSPLVVTSTTRVANLNVATSGVANTVNDAAQSNITSVGTLTSLSVSGNATVGNVIGPLASGNSNVTVTANANITMYVAGNTTARFTATSTGVVANGTFSASGNITGANLIGPHASGNSNISITSNANISMYVAGNANVRFVVTDTGANINGTLSVSGNANVGNLGIGGLITATGNLNAGNIITAGLMSSTGNITTGGLITATGNITGGNLVTAGNIYGANLLSIGTTGADFNIIGSTQTTADTAGGNINITAGVSNGNAVGGGLYITGGSSSAGTGIANGGLVQITGGTGGASGLGGKVTISGGGSSNANAALAANIQVNAGTVAGTGGSITVSGGNANGSQKAGGTITIAAGASTGSIGAGRILLQTSTRGGTSGNTLQTLANRVVIDDVTVNLVTSSNSTSTTSGTLVVVGGAGIGGNLYVGGIINGTTLTTGANTTAGTITGSWTLSAGSTMQATYADLAEYYEADKEYQPATVLEFGGDKEVTIASDGTTRVAGVVSTNPAYAMNANCQGITVAIALQGRVPTKVRGNVRKGDMMVSAGDGYARPSLTPQMGTVIGKALENFDGIEGVIEVAVGRL